MATPNRTYCARCGVSLSGPSAACPFCSPKENSNTLPDQQVALSASPPVQKHLLILSQALFTVSLVLQPFHTSKPTEGTIGLTLLLIGWLGALDGIFAWFANPLLFVGWRRYSKGQISSALKIAIASFLLAATFLLDTTILADEGGGRAKILSYDLGYWLWLASPLALLLACMQRLKSSYAGMQ